MRYLIAGVVLLSYLALCWFCWRRYCRQQAKLREYNISTSNNFVNSNTLVNSNSLSNSKIFINSKTSINSKNRGDGGDNDSAKIIVAYASQTGAAAVFASQSVQQLRNAGKDAGLLTLNQLTPKLLANAETLLIIVSTYGEGEAPDNGNRFISHCLSAFSNSAAQPLAHLKVALLGLGDSSYQFFCGFAHKLHHELHFRGAQLLTDVIEVDRLDESALRHWQYYLGQISGATRYADWSRPDYSEWNLIAREHINPGSPGAPAFHIQLKPSGRAISATEWQAGDIAEIGPGNSDEKIIRFLRQLGRDAIQVEALRFKDLQLSAEQFEAAATLSDEHLLASLTELPHREYSIASVPAEGNLALLVRQVNNGAGQLGLGSGWLTAHAKLNQSIQLRIRSNLHFHSPTDNRPLILIGNGTGIAGLRAHLANPARSGSRNWLLFGERTAAADYFFSADLKQWQHTGLLSRIDVVFSRDAQAGSPRYVQDLLPPNAEELRQWVAEGATIFVCGSLKGMAQAVDDFLREILGADLLEQMADERRYCRDVY